MAETGNKRPQQVAHLIQHEIGALLQKGLKDPRVGFVTVTDVRLPGDLRQATVYVSVLGEPAAREASLLGLRAAAGYLRREIGRTLKMRYSPELRFVSDSTLDRAEHIDRLLAAAQGGAEAAADSPAAAALPAPHTGREMPPPEAFAPPVAAAEPRAATRRRRAARSRRSK